MHDEFSEPSVHRVAVPLADGGERTLAVAAMTDEGVARFAEMVQGDVLGVDDAFPLADVDGVLPKDNQTLIEEFAPAVSTPRP